MLHTALTPRQDLGTGTLPSCCHHGQAEGFVLRSPSLQSSLWSQRSGNWLQAQAHWSQTSLEAVKVQHGCIHSWGTIARQKTTNLNGKAPKRSKSCEHQGMSPSKLPNAQSCCCLSTQPLRQSLRGSRAGKHGHQGREERNEHWRC